MSIDLLTGRVWLVPTFKTAAAEEAARNFVGSVSREVGLPEVLVSDTRFTSALWTGSVHMGLGASLIYGSPHHHNTTSKTGRVNGFVADVLRSFAGEYVDDRPALVPPVEFAINSTASPLGSGNTPFYADRSQHPRRPLATAAAPDPAGPGDGAAHSHGARDGGGEGAAAGAAGPAQGGARRLPAGRAVRCGGQGVDVH